MSSKAPTNILLFLIIVLLAVFFVLIVGGVIWGLMRARKKNTPSGRNSILLSLLAIFIAIASWFFNLGWIRFFLTFLLVPFIHAVVFFLVNLFISSYSDEYPTLKKYNLLFMLTYVIGYLLLPDGGDTGGLYFFFYLVQNDTLSYIALFASTVAFISHIILFVIQIIHIIKKKRGK